MTPFTAQRYPLENKMAVQLLRVVTSDSVPTIPSRKSSLIPIENAREGLHTPLLELPLTHFRSPMSAHPKRSPSSSLASLLLIPPPQYSAPRSPLSPPRAKLSRTKKGPEKEKGEEKYFSVVNRLDTLLNNLILNDFE
jgi:hypothetical protein